MKITNLTSRLLNLVCNSFKKHPEQIIIIIILLLGAWLRFYQFDNLLRFNNDQVRDIKIVEKIKANQWPFLGPKAGGTTFHLGPAFYYLEFLSGILFDFSPTGIAFFIPILSFVSIYLFYLFFRKIFALPITLVLTLLYSTSFFIIKYSRFAWNPNAIPFFLLAFFLLLNNFYTEKKYNWLNCLLLGLVTGIGMQLHTTLLILMPVTILLTLSLLLFFKMKTLPSWSKIVLLFIVIATLNIPFIYGSFKNQGENFSAFLYGTQKKTNNKINFLENSSKTAVFFLQGNFYQLTGQEPKSNWLNLSKMINQQNFKELLKLCLSVAFLVLGIYLAWKYFLFKKEAIFQKNFSAFLLLIFLCLSLLFFLIIGGELNLRFFIILNPIPLLFLGLIFQWISQKNIRFGQIIIVVALGALLYSNLSIYAKAYNLNNYQLPDSTYGGISQKELIDLCMTIDNLAKEKTVKIEKFNYATSLNYICRKKTALSPVFISRNKINKENLFFIIANKDKKTHSLNYYKKTAELIAEFETGRFVLLTFQTK